MHHLDVVAKVLEVVNRVVMIQIYFMARVIGIQRIITILKHVPSGCHRVLMFVELWQAVLLQIAALLTIMDLNLLNNSLVRLMRIVIDILLSILYCGLGHGDIVLLYRAAPTGGDGPL